MEARIAKTMPTHKRKPNLRRNATHRKFVSGLKICLACGRRGPVECCHVRAGTDGGGSLKPSDKFTVPMCHACHDRQHNKWNGSEVRFWAEIGIDPLNISLRLWCVSGDVEAGMKCIEKSLLGRGAAT